jgi:iron complex outermembrane receptor protein
MRIPLVVMMAIAAGTTSVSAQALRLSGRVTDSAGDPLGGVRVEERGTLNGTVTRADGTYELRYSSANAVIVFAQLGYRRQEFSVRNMANLDVVMEVAVHVIEGMEVVGTRRADRSAVETPVAVDVIDVPALIQSVGQLEVNQLLHYVAPSFNANRQSGADGSDHIDPATLRGLGPDQTLVLINGKRQHQSSLINIFGSRGRGNTGTDLNAIPLAAIDRKHGYRPERDPASRHRPDRDSAGRRERPVRLRRHRRSDQHRAEAVGGRVQWQRRRWVQQREAALGVRRSDSSGSAKSR